MNSTNVKANTANNRKARNVALTFAVPALAMTAVVAPLGATTASAQTTDSVTPSVTQAVTGTKVQSTLDARISHYSGGGTTIAGKRWLQGRGVDVIKSRQCTELAFRLYETRNWGTLFNIYSTHPYDKRVKFYRNGSGYIPVPGDVLVELGGSYQHVAVVDFVTPKAVHTVEQNAVPSGRHEYPLKKFRYASGAYGPRHVGGYLHSVKNHFKNQRSLYKKAIAAKTRDHARAVAKHQKAIAAHRRAK